jgi:glycosyltransferase involved in cell wall biosynthesis
MRTPRRSVLVLSTTPPIPREYGNRNRVHQTISFFRSMGFGVSFLLYPLDREWVGNVPFYYRQLIDMFDYCAVIPNSKKLHQNAVGYHHEIDEWWDDNIAGHLMWIFQRKRFDALLVNYTFLTKAFEYAPSNVIKILDTHDLFSGRRELFEKFGIPPEFFYTSPEQESVALDRADAVLAIKQSEAVALTGLTFRKVITLPYWDDLQVNKRTDTSQRHIYNHDRPLRLGFLGAHNSVNIVNLRRFLSIFYEYYKMYNLSVEVIIAGNVCEGVQQYPFAKKMGFLEDATDFYNMIDAVVVPLQFSTGIKIKVAEALAWNVPVLATRDAFDGFRAFHSTQEAPTFHALCGAIVSLVYAEISPVELAWATRKAAQAAALAQDRGIAELRSWIDASLNPVVRACRQLLTCLNKPVENLSPGELVARAGALARDDTFRPLAGQCAQQICETLGYPRGSWGLSQKIFDENFDIGEQIQWINDQLPADD